MADLTLLVEGTRTVNSEDLKDLSDALEKLTQTHESESPIKIQSGSIRWRDGEVWVRVTIETEANLQNIVSERDKLAQFAVETELQNSVQDAIEETRINVS
jgi:hypothetical protein